MKKSILITGASGAGKTALSEELKMMGYSAYDMDDLPDLFSMIDKKTGKPVVDHDNDNLEKVRGMDWICDREKLKRIIESEKEEIAFYCGNATNINEIIPLFDKIVLLKVNDENPRHRLTSRTKNDFAKTTEVQDWVLSWKEWWENKMEGKGAIIVDANRDLKEVTKDVIGISL